MAGKKDSGAVPATTTSVQDFMSDTPPLMSLTDQPKVESAQGKPLHKKPTAEKLTRKWGTYTVQRGYRLPIALLEALQGYVAERRESDRKYTETQAVCEAVAKLLADQGVEV